LARDVREMEAGDFVRLAKGGCYKKIAHVSPGVEKEKPLPREGFYVITEDGQKVSMYEAGAYFKKEDLEK
jgi:hypothetical protein